MAALNKNMLREYWSRQQAMTNLKFGFDLGVLLQCDFKIDILRGGQTVMTSDTWVMEAASMAPSQLAWSYDAETFGAPLPTFSNQPCSVTFLTKGQNPLDAQDESVGRILADLYATQFDSQTGVLALPSKSNKLSFKFSVMGTMPTEMSILKESIAEAKENGQNELLKVLKTGKKAARQTDKIKDDSLSPFVLFELTDVKLGTPTIAVDPKSMTPMGVKIDFVYRNSRWRDFAAPTQRRRNESFELASFQTTDDALIGKVKENPNRYNTTDPNSRNNIILGKRS